MVTYGDKMVAVTETGVHTGKIQNLLGMCKLKLDIMKVNQ